MAKFSSFAVLHALLHLLHPASTQPAAPAHSAASAHPAAATPWPEDPVARFNLPSEMLPQALIEFYYQCGIAPGFAATPQMENSISNPVFGVMPSSVALTRLLKGTGFTYQLDIEDSVDVIPIKEPQKPLVATRPSILTVTRLAEIDVTGSLIPGAQAAIAPLIRLDRAQLAMTDFATVQDSVYSLPVMSMNGPREDLGIDANYQDGAGLDLRGLGVGATLVLVNGYRQPLGGFNGDFVDVSSIPLSAVERIEVLPDGASALYGSDAIAGVVNIITRDNFEGAETQVRYGTAIGGRREVMASQLWGKHWSRGHAMLAYEYSDETPLAAAERPYAANADKTPYGGQNYDTYYSAPGNILNPTTTLPAYGIPAGQNGQGLTPAALSPTINLENPFSEEQIFPEVMAHELYGTAAEDFWGRLQMFLEGRFTKRDTLKDDFPENQVLVVPQSNPFYVNPFAGVPYTLIAYSFSRDLGPQTFSAGSQVYVGTVGAKLTFGETWQATLSESYGRQSLRSEEYNVTDPAALAASLADPNPATALNPFGDGSNTNPATLATIKRVFPLNALSRIESTRLVAEGSLFGMPAGDAKVAVGFERREEGLAHDVADPLNPTEQTIPQSYGRRVTSLFSELALPLAGHLSGPHAVPQLELDVAGRYEHYSDFGNTFDPMVRIHWIPVDALKLRASWGRSFRAPTLDDLYDTSNNAAESVVLPDPSSSTGRSLVLVEVGSNPHLKQETAKTWTAGFDLAPKLLVGSAFSLTYYSIDYESRIAEPAADNPFAILESATEWAAVITRNPSPTKIAAVCNRPDYLGSVPACLASSPSAIVDFGLSNLAATHTAGLDVEAHDALSSGLGTFGLGIAGNYVLMFDQAVTPTAPAVDIVNTFGNPLGLRFRGTIEWNRKETRSPGLGLSLTVNHTGGYKNPGSTLLPSVSPWTTVDARVVYRMKRGDGWLSGSEFSANVVNLLNHDPPFTDAISGYDAPNVQPLGRVVSVDIAKRW